MYNIELIKHIQSGNLIEAKQVLEQNILESIQQRLLGMKQQYAAKRSVLMENPAKMAPDLLKRRQFAMNPASIVYPEYNPGVTSQGAGRKYKDEKPVTILNKDKFEKTFADYKKSNYFFKRRRKKDKINELAREERPGEDVGVFQTEEHKIGDKVFYGPDPRKHGFPIDPKEHIWTVKKIHTNRGVKYVTAQKNSGLERTYPHDSWTEYKNG